MNSRVNSEFAGHTYSKLLVVAAFYDLGLQESCEKKMVADLEARGVQAMGAHTILFPGRDYSASEYRAILDQNSIEAVLVVFPSDAGLNQQYIPPTERSTTKGEATAFGNTLRYSQTTKTTTSGGYNVNKPWGTYEAELYDAENGETVWYATASSSGNALSNFGTLAKAVGGKTVKKLAQDGLIK